MRCASILFFRNASYLNVSQDDFSLSQKALASCETKIKITPLGVCAVSTVTMKTDS